VSVPVQTVKTFTDTFLHSIDAKNRLTVPSRWRFEGDDREDAYLIISHIDGYLMVLPPWRSQALVQQVQNRALFSKAQQDTLTALAMRMSSCGVDKQGRITLSERMLRTAGLTKEAVLLGQMDLFKIYSREKWLEIENQSAGDHLRSMLEQTGL
jgi:MraZ protein